MFKYPRLRLRFIGDDPDGGGKTDPPAEKAEGDDLAKALAEAEKWKALSRQNEARAKENAEKAKRVDELEAQSKTALEKAVDEARAAGRAEVQAQLGLERVNSAFEKALAGRVPDTSALLSLDRSQFVTGDMADLEKITEWVEKNSTETVAKKKDVDLGQGRGRGTEGPAKGVSVGADLFNSRKKSS